MEIFIRSVSVNACLNDMYVVHDLPVISFSRGFRNKISKTHDEIKSFLLRRGHQ